MVEETAKKEILDLAWSALRGVIDPELALDIVALGLIYRMEFVEDRLECDMTLTTVGCPVSESMPIQVQEVLERCCSTEVEVKLVWSPPWGVEMIDPVSAKALGLRR
ncbi:metal-sulfur cluster assembly factor [Acidithrix sp. C25]|uniref:metal-sulfur cluster assembly factor n=1 Tax=Acidithrix sp. C25 TaxID=1671482 RepID=UPI00191BC433|nr:metal-sulfur cluster assembly factor [Acidithrix sp. C25]